MFKWVVGRGSLKFGVAGFCWLSEIASIWVRYCWVSGLLRLVMGLVEIDVGHGEVVRGGDGGGFQWVLLCFWVSIVTLGFCWQVRCC